MKKLWNKIHPAQPLRDLQAWDLLLLALIFFGEATLISTQSWLMASPDTAGSMEFSAADNWQALQSQGLNLLLALLYLLLRNYDFKQLTFKFEKSVLWWPILIYLAAGLASDISFLTASFVPGLVVDYNPLAYLPFVSFSPVTVLEKFAVLDVSTVLYSLFNGFYEEFFFLGLLWSTKSSWRWPVLLFSTFVRTAFHTYQGLFPALVIGVSFGLVYYVIYRHKTQNLLHFSLGHALADMIGINLFLLFLPL